MKRHKLWKACLTLAQAKPEFTLDDIAVAAFLHDPIEFGMKEHRYPDTRKISVLMSGPRSMLKIGAIVKITTSTYGIGVEPRQEPAKGNQSHKIGTVSEKDWLRSIVHSRVAAKMNGTVKGTISRLDAMAVLGARKLSDIRAAHTQACATLRRLEAIETVSEVDVNLARAVLNRLLACC